MIENILHSSHARRFTSTVCVTEATRDEFRIGRAEEALMILRRDQGKNSLLPFDTEIRKKIEEHRRLYILSKILQTQCASRVKCKENGTGHIGAAAAYV